MVEPRYFRTLRGFLSGEEPEGKNFFAFSATLRIFGNIPDLEEITAQLGVEPTKTHHVGDRPGPKSPAYKHDMWSFSPDIPAADPLECHIEALWSIFKPKRNYLLKLKESLNVDVFLGYRSNCDHAGIEVPHTCLEMFTELEIPFGLSIIVA